MELHTEQRGKDMDRVFKGDGGVTYLLRDREDGGLTIVGGNTGTTWVGVGNRVEITGKVRNHGRFGLAQRAVLTIDVDSEGDETNIRGVVLVQMAMPI